MDIKVSLLETRQNYYAPRGALLKGRRVLQAEHIQREEKINVSIAFRADNIKNYLSQWNSITADKFIIETVKRGLKIDFISKLVAKHIPQMAHSAEKSEIISGEIAKLLKRESTNYATGKRMILFLLSLLREREMEA